MQNRGQNGSPTAQIGVRRQRRGQRRRGVAAAAAAGGGGQSPWRATAGATAVGPATVRLVVALFLRRLLLTRDGESEWTLLHITICNRDPVTMLLLLVHGALANGDGPGG